MRKTAVNHFHFIYIFLFSSEPDDDDNASADYVKTGALTGQMFPSQQFYDGKLKDHPVAR